MKVLILCALVAVSQAAVIYAPGILGLGGSAQYRSQDGLGNYAFGYNEGHVLGTSFRRESGDAAGNKVGSYGLKDADGRVRIVNYVAGAQGFKADIKTNEPGVDETKPAADTKINKVELVAPTLLHAGLPILAPHLSPLGAVGYAYAF